MKTTSTKRHVHMVSNNVVPFCWCGQSRLLLLKCTQAYFLVVLKNVCVCVGLVGCRRLPGVISFSLQSWICEIALDTASTSHWQTMVCSSHDTLQVFVCVLFLSVVQWFSSTGKNVLVKCVYMCCVCVCV